MQITLRVIDVAEIDGRHVIAKDSPDHALVWDHGQTDLTCGACGFTLAAKILGPEILAGYVLECPDCGATNSPL
jgi:ribosomal protein S27E